MTAYDPREWSDLFVATAGASAALAGLVFVAISINLDRILSLPGVPERGLETVLLLVLVLVVSIIGLIPAQTHLPLGIELLAIGLMVAMSLARLPAIQRSGKEPRGSVLTRRLIRLAATVPFVLGGLSVLLEAGGGLYWIVAGILVATVGAVANAWVLLVEILR